VNWEESNRKYPCCGRSCHVSGKGGTITLTGQLRGRYFSGGGAPRAKPICSSGLYSIQERKGDVEHFKPSINYLSERFACRAGGSKTLSRVVVSIVKHLLRSGRVEFQLPEKGRIHFLFSEKGGGRKGRWSSSYFRGKGAVVEKRESFGARGGGHCANAKALRSLLKAESTLPKGQFFARQDFSEGGGS